MLKAANIKNKGASMDGWILGPERVKTLAPWCKLAHMSTENLTIGTLMKPISDTVAHGFSAIIGSFVKITM
jgi:hypothetical protein